MVEKRKMLQKRARGMCTGPRLLESLAAVQVRNAASSKVSTSLLKQKQRGIGTGLEELMHIRWHVAAGEDKKRGRGQNRTRHCADVWENTLTPRYLSRSRRRLFAAFSCSASACVVDNQDMNTCQS